MKFQDIILAIIVSLVWGGNYIAVKYTIIEIPSFLAIAIRFSSVALITLPFTTKPNRANFKDLYALSLVVGIFYLGLLYYGVYLGLDTSAIVIIMQLNIPFSIIIAFFVFNEKLTKSAIIGIIIAFVGVCITIGAPHVNHHYLAVITVLGAAVFGAIYNIQCKKLHVLSPVTLLCWSNLIAAPHLWIISYFIEGNPIEYIQNSTSLTWLGIMYSVSCSSLIGVISWIYLLQNNSIHVVTPFNLLVPVFGVFFSILFFKDAFTWHFLFGGLMTILGVTVSQIKTFSFVKNK